MNLGGEARYIAYSSGNFAKNILWSTADVTLLYVLTDLLQVPATTAGTIFLVGLLCDAVLDPVVGTYAERTRTRLGQYGPFIIIGAPLSAAAFFLLYSLPALQVRRLDLIVVCAILFRASYAIGDLPHTALITKVATTSRDRGRVAGYRFFFSSLASLLLSFVIPYITIARHPAQHLAQLALAASVASALLLFTAWFAVRDRDVISASSDPTPFGHRLRGVLANPTFAPLAWIVFCTGLSVPLFAKSCIYYAKYVLMRPEGAGLALTGLAIGQFAGVCLWTWAASHWEKAWALGAAHLVAAAAFILIGLLSPAPWMMVGLCACAGIGLGGVYMLIWAMAPDVVDYGEYCSGVRNEATTFAVLLLISKVATGLGAALLGWCLDLSGYVPDVVPPQGVQIWIVLAACAAPAIGCLVCAALTRRYLLTHRRHARAVLRHDRSAAFTAGS